MICQDAQRLLGGYVDGELDLLRQLEMEEHLAECAACGRARDALQVLGAAVRSDEMYYRAPVELQRRVRQVARNAEPHRERVSRRWIGIAASVAVVAAAGWSIWAVLFRSPATEHLSSELVASHVRSLMPGHLTDMISSDQHTVKPWFSGKLDFSPAVADFPAQGFVLVGGRLDYLGGRPVAAVIYRRRQHLINLFTWPDAGAAGQTMQAESRQGYHLIRWRKAGMAYWLISDLNEKELRELAGLLQ